MDNSLELGDLIRSRILDRHLPSHPDARIFTGEGDGQICACCNRPVTRHDLQIDVEHPSRAASPVVAMHRTCFQLWCGIAEELSAGLPARPAQNAETRISGGAAQLSTSLRTPSPSTERSGVT